MSDFWSTHEVKSGSGYLSPEEKDALAKSGQPFEITGVAFEADNKFGPRYKITLALPDEATGETETRLMGLAKGSGVTSRDDILQAMIDDHFGAGESDPISAILEKAGNSYLIKPAP